MGWILLEALVALALGLFIVWWTMRSRRAPRRPADDRDSGDAG